MQQKLLNTIGQSLIGIGLYTVAFESLVLTIKDQIQGHLMTNDPKSLKKFNASLATANNTLKFCEPRRLSAGVLSSDEMAALVRIRQRRNKMAHEGYNDTFTLSIDDVTDDIRTMFLIARKVENWRQAVRQGGNGNPTPFCIAPSIFGLYLEAATTLARTSLAIPVEDSEASLKSLNLSD